MALQKSPVTINFAQGLDTKTDPHQVQIGKFLVLNNMIFDTIGQLKKRNGNTLLSTLTAEQTTLTTLNGNLIATGSNLSSYSADTNTWINQGDILPVGLSTLPLVRTSTSQSAQDSVTASNGLVCVAYEDTNGPYFIILDSTTGQKIVEATALPSGASNLRTFTLGKTFIITFLVTISGSIHLQYISIPYATLAPSPSATTVSTSVYTTSGANPCYDGTIFSDDLYLAWTSAPAQVSCSILYPSVTLTTPTVIITTAGFSITSLVLCSDTDGIWISCMTGAAGYCYTVVLNSLLAPLCALTIFAFPVIPVNFTVIASNGTATFFIEYPSTYTGTSIKTDYIQTSTMVRPVNPTAGCTYTIGHTLRSVGLASKAFIGPNLTPYCLATYGEQNQPTYFLIDSSTNIYMRLAYSNGGGYVTSPTLPSVSQRDASTFQVSYLYKDFLTNVNKTTIPSYTGPSTALYAQTGINLATITINSTPQYSTEIAGALHLTGGMLWEYDGIKPVEHGFHVWPENITATWQDTGGNMVANPSGWVAGQPSYFYQFTYEWTDNQGNIHRSAPSIPLAVTRPSDTSTTGSVTLQVPTLRLTYKTSPNPVRIVGYRWSIAQQVYYQFTTVPASVSNDPTVDSVTITDTSADSAILGQTLLYTTGGVVEDICAPASIASCLYKNRLILIDAEDQNLLWYSKQVIEAVPVEMSDLFTLYIAPTTGTQGSTGPCTAVSAMDDKLVIFKRNAVYYVTGTGPDNTGSNNDFSDPIFITSAVGSANPDSIVLMQSGLMFQTDGKGIWLLGRDLGTSYVGAPVEAYNAQTVMSAQAIPGTNQVRFILDNNVTLVYDYFMQQWSTFNNISAISSTLYQNLPTYLNSYGQVFQETPGKYFDGSSPVLMGLTTSWINIVGLQGFERLYEMLLLGNYYSPFKLNVQLAYDYNPSNSQAIIVTPDNYGGTWGGGPVWGAGGGWGGAGQPFEARIFPQIQKCSSFQVSINEIYDSSFGASTGQGLSLSGLTLIVGAKRAFRTQKAGRSFG